mgnify:CR=1 FL=1
MSNLLDEIDNLKDEMIATQRVIINSKERRIQRLKETIDHLEVKVNRLEGEQQ